MGMFDTVECQHHRLPGFPSRADRTRFQTKSIDDPYLRHHRITEDGRLVQILSGGPDDPYPVRTDLNFHGTLNFYTIGMNDAWHEFKATFTDGQLVEIVRVPE